LSGVTIYVINTLSQPVRYRIKGNVVKSTQNSIQIGTERVVQPSQVDAVTLTPETSGYMPIIYLELQCDVPPGQGSVTAFMTRSPWATSWLVYNLQIRDAVQHDPSTDPKNIFYGYWYQ